MHIYDFLMDSNPVIQRLTKIQLFNEQVDYIDEGWIKDIRLKFDWQTHTWGKEDGPVSVTNGIYDPWWTSTFYTLLDLITFNANPSMEEAKLGLKQVLHFMWNPETDMENDVCVIAMMLRVVLYFDPSHPATFELLNMLLNEQKEDGGWNCEHSSQKGSFHTTLSVLEAYRDFSCVYPTIQQETLLKQIKLGELYLTSRKLLYRQGTQQLVFSGIDVIHFPVRWRYDYVRALDYFASVNAQPSQIFDDAIQRLKLQFKDSQIHTNKTYPGQTHINMNDQDVFRFNTFRAILILSWFEGKSASFSQST